MLGCKNKKNIFSKKNVNKGENGQIFSPKLKMKSSKDHANHEGLSKLFKICKA